jgi:hypothetical protein
MNIVWPSVAVAFSFGQGVQEYLERSVSFANAQEFTLLWNSFATYCDEGNYY